MLTIIDNSDDSGDEFLMNVALRGRNAKIYRPREDHYAKWTDKEFFVRFRLTKETVLELLDLIREDLETSTDRSLSPMNQLLLTLRFYALGSLLISVGDFSGVHKSTASVIIKKVSLIIANLRPQFIHFPHTAADKKTNQVEFYSKNHFPRVVGAIDCTHIRIQSPGYALTPYLLTPLRNPLLPEENLYNEAQIRTRGTVERQYGVWKRRFPVLSLGMRISLDTCQDVIVACAVLHNIAINANEEEPPMDPNCLPLNVVNQEIPIVPDHQHHQANAAVQRQMVEYFRQLL
uniref:DDE Tnp4 domain-containing protein n=2 Tax=Timema TaxID=61471 RepID=A0A7R8VYH1_TIMDO|nr:unnamed protein product [Timema douglasi]